MNKLNNLIESYVMNKVKLKRSAVHIIPYSLKDSTTYSDGLNIICSDICTSKLHVVQEYVENVLCESHPRFGLVYTEFPEFDQLKFEYLSHAKIDECFREENLITSTRGLWLLGNDIIHFRDRTYRYTSLLMILHTLVQQYRGDTCHSINIDLGQYQHQCSISYGDIINIQLKGVNLPKITLVFENQHEIGCMIEELFEIFTCSGDYSEFEKLGYCVQNDCEANELSEALTICDKYKKESLWNQH